MMHDIKTGSLILLYATVASIAVAWLWLGSVLCWMFNIQSGNWKVTA